MCAHLMEAPKLRLSMVVWAALGLFAFGVLMYDARFWPFLFLIPVVLILYLTWKSKTDTYNEYRKNIQESALIGRVDYGMDSQGKTTHRVRI